MLNDEINITLKLQYADVFALF